MATQSTGTRKARARNGRDRKQDILNALYRCMARKGYAGSTLSDVAGEAGMSSSHLLYYFSGKEAILEAFFKEASAQAKLKLQELPEAPKERLDAFADIFLPAKADKTRRAVMMDLNGQSAQNRTLRRLKSAQDRAIKRELVNVFGGLPRATGLDADAAAHSAFAMLRGLETASFFDTSLQPAEAHRLFRLSLYRLGGLKPPRTRRSASKS